MRRLYGDGVNVDSGSFNKAMGGSVSLKNGVRRVRVVPTNPQTSYQQEVRAAFNFLTGEWAQTLTEAQRAAWESARTGNVYYLKQDALTGVSRAYGSAKDLFIAMNLNFLVVDGSLSAPIVQFSVPGTSTGLDVLGITSVVLDASAGSVVVTFTGTQTLESMILKATPPVSTGNMRTTSVRSKFRVASAVGASPAAVGAAYVARLGAITGAAGMKVFWEVVAMTLITGKTRVVASGNSVIIA